MPTLTDLEFHRLKKIEGELVRLRELDTLKPWAEAFARYLAMLAATTPYVHWTARERTALDAAFKGSTAGLRDLYISRLPAVDVSDPSLRSSPRVV